MKKDHMQFRMYRTNKKPDTQARSNLVNATYRSTSGFISFIILFILPVQNGNIKYVGNINTLVMMKTIANAKKVNLDAFRKPK